MANNAEILEVLGTLADYYAVEPNDAQLRLYVRALADLTGAELQAAADEYIKAGKWFPKVSELREIAERMAEQPEAQPDLLEAEVLDLKDAFLFEGEYNPARLEAIAVLYERSECEYRAAWVRREAADMAAIVEGTGSYGRNWRDKYRPAAAAGSLPARPMAAGVPAGAGLVRSLGHDARAR